jgi:AraC family transcriptional regulator, positive regulator of tynA and feaB
MKTIFSTNGVHPRDRFDFWHEVACKQLVEHSSVAQSRQNFEAKIATGTLGNFELILFENSAMDVTRSANNLAHAGDDDLFFCRQVAGSVSVEQDGCRALLNAADLMLLDPLLPYQANFSSHSRTLVLKIPRKALEARVGNTRDMVAKLICPTDAAHRRTSLFIEMLPELAGELPPAAEAIAHEQTLDLIGTSLLTTAHSQMPTNTTVRSMALMNVRSAVELLLSNPSVGRAEIAQAAGVSVRYANALLAEQNTSITRLIQTRRLDRCRLALEDPLQKHRTISEIAYGWGFSDMTHFGRCFKAAYGRSPRDYRASWGKI